MIYDFSNYNIKKELKNSEKGLVFLGVHKNNDQKHILKLTRINEFNDLSYRGLFLNHHNIVRSFAFKKIYYFGECFYFHVQEFMNHGNLYFLKKNFIPVTTVDILDILEGIRFLHSKNIIHGDIKPGNIFVKNNQEKLIFKIGDFEIIEKKNQITPEFMAPEGPHKLSIQTDIWALGCVIYWIFLKSLPFGSREIGLNFEQIFNNSRTKGIPKSFLEIPEPFRYLIFKCLRKEPEKRWQNVSEMIEVLTSNKRFKRILWKKQYFKALLRKDISLS